MDALYIGFQLLCVSASALCVYACIRHASDADRSAHELRAQRARLIGFDAALSAYDTRFEKLQSRLKSLEGKFYQARDTVLAARDPLTVDAFSGVTDAEAHTHDPCENWLAAQLDGPRSKAAECQCAYCVTQRANRAAEKARILAERNRAKANGSE